MDSVGMLTLDECHKKQIHQKSLNNYYKKSTTLGKGHCGVVRKIVHKKTGVTYAAKYIKKNKSKQNWLAPIHNEIAILKNCKSKNIVELHDVFETSSHITLILDYLAGGDLYNVFCDVPFFSEVDGKTIIKQVLESVKILHNQNIVHMDIKMENILLSKPNCLDNIKLCDFELSRWVEPGKVIRICCGTLDYFSPELLKDDPISIKSDIWSIGVLTYALLCGVLPFSAGTDDDITENILKGVVNYEIEPFKSVSAEGINFIKTMLILDPTMRPTADELLQHAWISSDN